MIYVIVYKKAAEKELFLLPKVYAIKVREAINKLAHNPRPSGCKKLMGSINEFVSVLETTE